MHWFSIQEGPIHILPVLHERVEFADMVRLALEELKPERLAVELPASLEDPILRAAGRLPRVTILLYESTRGVPVYWIISPADPLVEGVRWALEQQLPVHFVDVDVDAPMQWQERFPDPYAALRLGPEAYYKTVREQLLIHSSTQDRLRERGMAYRLQKLSGRTVFICGLAHAQQVKDDLLRAQTEPMDRRERRVQAFHLHPESLQEVLWEPPFIHALYELRRNGLPPEPKTEGLDEGSHRVGRFHVLEGGRPRVYDEEHERYLALQWCAGRCQLKTDKEPEEGMSFERLLRHGGNPPPDGHRLPLDRLRAYWRWIQQTAHLYTRRTGERLQPWQIHNLMNFSRNYALLEGRLLPDFFQWVASARSCVDENFAYELWALGGTFPWQQETVEDLTTLRIHGEELWLGTRRMRIRPRVPRRKRPQRFPVRQRKKESRPGEWLEAFDGRALCSYPPEDVVVERFGGYLRSKGVRLLSEERRRVEPFVSSLLDGIDLRETLRNWHEGRIYVQEERRIRGGVGAVVVIFDPDESGSDYPYLMTWHGEHEQESDMAFYATALGSRIVGPGISRCEYGGFVMTYPPRRMWDVWHDPDYQILTAKPEVLLMAALDYSLEPNVVYVAAQPPRSWFHALAQRMGMKIVYLPVGQLSPTTMKRIRSFHVLSGYDKRDLAKDYIHKD